MENHKRAKELAYRFLARRARSERELKEKLTRKGVKKETIEEVVDKLKEDGYLNDTTFAFDLARYLAVNKLWSDLKIAFYLKEKGIEEGTITRAIEEARRELSQREAVAQLVEKNRASDKYRLVNRLKGRGFPLGLILEVIEDTTDEVK